MVFAPSGGRDRIACLTTGPRGASKMAEDKKSELNNILTGYEGRLAQKETEAARKLREEKEFLEEVKRVRAAVIEPVLAEISQTLKSRGHQVTIDTFERATRLRITPK